MKKVEKFFFCCQEMKTKESIFSIKLVLISFTIMVLIWRFSSQTVYLKNENGETIKNVRNYFTDKTKVIVFDSLGQKMEEFTRVNKKISGQFFTYFPNGSLKAVTNFENNQKNGVYKEFYPSNVMKYSFMLRNGKKHGLCNSYDNKGNLLSSNFYFNDKLNLQEIYTATGKTNLIEPIWINELDTFYRDKLIELSFCNHEDVIDVLGDSLYFYYNYLPLEYLENNELDYPTDSIYVGKGCVHFELSFARSGQFTLYYYVDRQPNYLKEDGYEFRVYSKSIFVK